MYVWHHNVLTHGAVAKPRTQVKVRTLEDGNSYQLTVKIFLFAVEHHSKSNGYDFSLSVSKREARGPCASQHLCPTEAPGLLTT